MKVLHLILRFMAFLSGCIIAATSAMSVVYFHLLTAPFEKTNYPDAYYPYQCLFIGVGIIIAIWSNPFPQDKSAE